VLKHGAQIADRAGQGASQWHHSPRPKARQRLLTATGAKLLDFGLAKLAAQDIGGAAPSAVATQATPVTAAGTIIGTFRYMSPEQVEGKELDGRSDIFSLGSVLYEMLTGQPAFPGKSQLSVASSILEKEPAPISTLKPLTPPGLDTRFAVA